MYVTLKPNTDDGCLYLLLYNIVLDSYRYTKYYVNLTINNWYV